MSKLRMIGSLLLVFITMPIWYYLLYKILILVAATELMWFLYWIYVPVGLIVSLIMKITEPNE